jgi:predicted nucleic acid-binding protein
LHKLRVYIDTSVIGGCLDEEFAKDSKALFDLFAKEEMIPVISNTVLEELEDAPVEVKKILELLPEHLVEIIGQSSESARLADLYISSGAVPDHSYEDALHIAKATINRVDVLVSWNFKHVVNIKRIHAYNSVNVKEGYPMLEIRSPKEVLDEEI